MIQLIIAGIIAAAAFFAGMQVSNWKCESEKLATIQEAEKLRRIDESFTQGVSAAYEGVAQQMRRIATVNRVETIRETQKVEYRCPLPDTGLRLLNNAIDNANAAASEPDAAVPADPAGPSERAGGAASIYD